MKSAKRYAPWLWLLLALFCVRVISQLVALYISFPFLPAFDEWHSATVPYFWLLISQILIIVIMATTAWRFTGGDVQPRPILGRLLLVLGGVYLGVMVVRLVLGSTVYAGHPWFDKILPTIFHLVLATFLLIVGRFHLDESANAKKKY